MEEQQYLSQEKFEELKKELEYLKNTKRKEVAERINETKELGDLSENADYQLAREEQAFTEGKIAELDNLLKKAKIVSKPTKEGVVQVGSTVKVQSDAGERTFQIVGSQEANPDAGQISNESPLGRVLLGKQVGDEVNAELPKGMVKYKVLAVS